MFKQREDELTRIACMLRDLLLVESAMYGTGSKVPCPMNVPGIPARRGETFLKQLIGYIEE